MVERRGRKPKSISKAIEKYRDQPAMWIEDTFGVELWEKQEEILKSVFNHRYTAVKSCYASGKSFVAAAAVMSFVHLYPDSIVVTTAPTYKQLENVWQNVHWLKDRAKADLGSDFYKHEIRCGPGHRAIGMTTNDPQNIQGQHAKYVLIIVDESAGIEPEIHERLDALMTGDHCHRLDIGNPLSPTGHFYDMFNSKRYKKMTISAFDTPNVKQDKEVIPGLVTNQWVNEQREKYGVDSPMWKSQVLGEFPPEGEEGLIPLTWIKKALNRWEEATPEGGAVFGFDPAGGGLDDNVLIKRCDSYVYEPIAWQVSSLPETVNMLEGQVMMNENIYVDNIGVGWGVNERLIEAGLNAIGVNVKASPTYDPEERFLNLRAQLYWELRERFNPQHPSPLAIPPTKELEFELANLQYETTSKGKIKIESKEDMKKRGLDSPNNADALMLTMMGEGADAMPISVDVDMLSETNDSLGDFSYQEWDEDMKNLKYRR